MKVGKQKSKTTNKSDVKATYHYPIDLAFLGTRLPPSAISFSSQLMQVSNLLNNSFKLQASLCPSFFGCKIRPKTLLKDPTLQALIQASDNYCHLGEAIHICVQGIILTLHDPSKNNHIGWLYFPGGKIGSESFIQFISRIYASVNEGVILGLRGFG